MTSQFRHVALIGKYHSVGAGASGQSSRRELEDIRRPGGPRVSTDHLQLHPRLATAAPVAWLGLGLAVWAVGLFEPGDVAIELPIVFVLAMVLLLALTEPWLARIVLVLLAFITPTLTMIAAPLAHRLGGEVPDRTPVSRTVVTVAVVSLPALVGAVLARMPSEPGPRVRTWRTCRARCRRSARRVMCSCRC